MVSGCLPDKQEVEVRFLPLRLKESEHMDIEPNAINQVRLDSEQEYIDLVLSFQDRFPSVDKFECHFEMDEPEEESEEWENGELLVDTMQWKPEKYPCVYVFCPMQVDDSKVGYNVQAWFDDFVYLEGV